METTGPLFQKNLKDNFTSALSKNPDARIDMIKDMTKFSTEMKETKVSKSNSKAQKNIEDMANIIKKIDDKKVRKEAASWMIKDFKKQFRDFDSNEFLKMCDLDSEKKSENKEATGTGSSGAYSAPLFGGEDKFYKESDKETPKLKEGIASNAMMGKKEEAKEATGSGSVGGYQTPAMWAKSTTKKDWGPSRKTQVPGGSFVKVKKKCTKFPYCNQGDINALHITKSESVKEAIKSVSKKLKISENVIITILEHEYENLLQRTK